MEIKNVFENIAEYAGPPQETIDFMNKIMEIKSPMEFTTEFAGDDELDVLEDFLISCCARLPNIRNTINRVSKLSATSAAFVDFI